MLAASQVSDSRAEEVTLTQSLVLWLLTELTKIFLRKSP